VQSYFWLWEQVECEQLEKLSDHTGTPVPRAYRIGTMTKHNLEETVALLSRMPATLNALLRDMPDTWTLRNEGPDSWSAYDVVGHLIHGERTDWMPRVKVILQFGESKAFEPFDRFAQGRESQGKSLEDLLDEFARLRSQNLADLRALKLSQTDLEQRGLHPSLEWSLYQSCWPPGRFTI